MQILYFPQYFVSIDRRGTQLSTEYRYSNCLVYNSRCNYYILTEEILNIFLYFKLNCLIYIPSIVHIDDNMNLVLFS